MEQERAARKQAERMAEKHISDLTQQRDNMTNRPTGRASNLEYFRLQKRCDDLESRNAKLSELVKKEARPAPAVAAKRKPTLKAATGRMRRLKGKNHPPAR